MLKPGAIPFTEIVDETPIAKPLRLRVPTQSERIMELVRYEQMRAMQTQEVETFEEADDFELDDGQVWFSPYEEVFEPDPGLDFDPAPAPVAPATQTAPPPEPVPAPAP